MKRQVGILLALAGLTMLMAAPAMADHGSPAPNGNCPGDKVEGAAVDQGFIPEAGVHLCIKGSQDIEFVTADGESTIKELLGSLNQNEQLRDVSHYSFIPATTTSTSEPEDTTTSTVEETTTTSEVETTTSTVVETTTTVPETTTSTQPVRESLPEETTSTTVAAAAPTTAPATTTTTVAADPAERTELPFTGPPSGLLASLGLALLASGGLVLRKSGGISE